MLEETESQKVGLGTSALGLLRDLCGPNSAEGALLTSYFDTAIRHVEVSLQKLVRKDLDGTTAENWVVFFYETYALEPIVMDNSRRPQLELVEQQEQVDDGRGQLSYRDKVFTHYFIPVQPNEQLAVLLGMTPSGPRWSSGTRPDWTCFVDSDYMVVSIPAESQFYVEQTLEEVRQFVDHINEDIGRGNKALRPLVEERVNSRFAEIEARSERFVSMLEYFGAELRPTADTIERLSRVPTVRKHIQRLRNPLPVPKRTPRLERRDFETILSVINAMGMTFERTPPTISKLDEEAIRDLLLATLNAAFDLDAVGEAFSKQGKTDIRLRVPQGGIFIAEAKIWEGPAAVEKAVDQIRNYLTWRDAFGVVLSFSRNQNFSTVRSQLRDAIAVSSSLRGDVHDIEDHHWSAAHVRANDDQEIVELHYLVYDINPSRSSNPKS